MYLRNSGDIEVKSFPRTSLIRWLSWLQAVAYLCKYIDFIKGFVIGQALADKNPTETLQ